MALRRFQPIARSASWAESGITWTDPRTRVVNSLDGAVLTMALYQRQRRGPRDYGRWFSGCADTPVVSAVTQADGSGPFFVAPDQMSAAFNFPIGTLANLCPGDAELVVWAATDDGTFEILRETIPVEDGLRVLPAGVTPPSSGAAPTPAPASAPQVVTGSGPVTVASSGAYLVLNGPTQVLLPVVPRAGFTVTLKDGGSVALTGAITITPAGMDTIDGQAVLRFTAGGQAATLTYAAGSGWLVT